MSDMMKEMAARLEKLTGMSTAVIGDCPPGEEHAQSVLLLKAMLNVAVNARNTVLQEVLAFPELTMLNREHLWVATAISRKVNELKEEEVKSS